MKTTKYKRVVLKLSGESLAGEQGFGINPEVVESIALQVKEIRKHDIDVAVVVGGGNIWRGLAGSAKGMDRATADYMGMLATVMAAASTTAALGDDFFGKSAAPDRNSLCLRLYVSDNRCIRRVAFWPACLSGRRRCLLAVSMVSLANEAKLVFLMWKE